MTIRLLGLALLGIGAVAIWRLHALVVALPHHHAPTLAEMILSLITVLAGISGAATLVEGADLFRIHEWPPRHPGARSDRSDR